MSENITLLGVTIVNLQHHTFGTIPKSDGMLYFSRRLEQNQSFEMNFI